MSFLNVYSSSHIVHGLPKHIEQVSRDDLEFELLTSLIENDLHLTQSGSKLSIVVVDFLVTKTKSAKWHKDKITEIMQIVECHPKGNFIRFGMLFMTPDLVKIREMTGSISPRHNVLRLFE